MATITPLPPAPSRSDDPDTFAQKGDALLSALVSPFVGEANALIAQADIDSANASTQAAVATAQASIATASASTANAVLWVSGTTYTAGTSVVYSPITYKTYRRKTNGAGTTDPSLDITNWQPVVELTEAIVSKSANYSILISDKNTIFSCTGSFTLSYPNANTLGNGWVHAVSNDGTGSITLTPSSGTINGSSSIVLSPGDNIKIISDNTNYQIARFSSKNSGTIATSIASSSTIVLDNANGDTVHITGTTNITAMTLSAGKRKVLIFDSALILTNSTSLVLPNGFDVYTYSGLCMEFVAESGGIVRGLFVNITEQYLKVSDQKTSGTPGGTSTNGSFTQVRTLNTVDFNSIVGSSLSSNAVTLPAGTYRTRISAPSSYLLGNSRIFLYNTTDSAYTLLGTSACPGAGNNFLVGRFTITSQKTFNVRHWTNNTSSTSDLGGASSLSGQPEVYTQAEFWRIS